MVQAPTDAFRQSFNRFVLHDPSGLTIADGLSGTTGIAGHHRHPEGLGLDEHVGQTLHPGGEQKEVHPLQPGLHHCALSRQVEPVSQAHLLGVAPGLFQHRAIAHDDEMNLRIRPGDLGGDLDPEVGSLLLRQAKDSPDHRNFIWKAYLLKHSRRIVVLDRGFHLFDVEAVVDNGYVLLI